MPALPTGTVTFLFTDLEGSTRVWEERRDAMAAAVERHDELLEGAVTRHGGVVFARGGDGLSAAFSTAPDAVAAAVEGQRALASEPWGETGALRSRMGVHTGEGRVLGADGMQYESHSLNRCARLMAVAHGEQLVISATTAELVQGALPPGCELVDLGEHALRDLQSTMHVYQVAGPGLRSTFPPLRSLDARPGNLPRQVTTFVGRTTEIELLADLVRDTPLVTLTGVGGVGKTRLALQVAAEAVADFPDGAWLCELAPVADPGATWEVLAGCLGVQAVPGRKIDETVLEYLALKHLLLVLDNCEHLLDAVARQVTAITQRCPEVSVLATSREGLALAGERIVAVPSLAVPADNHVTTLLAADAVHLFTDRARAAKHDFAPDDRNIAAVGELCRRLDGIPLAIELAAARVRTLSPDDLVARLDQRFKLLTRGSRAALERHQTLRSTIDWSYDLLDEPERRALDRLSVFAGSCDLAAAEAVLAAGDLDAVDVADALSQLVDKSLVLAEDKGGVRFRLFESIRQYAGERLEADGETAAVRRRHADHYVGVAEAAGPHLRSREQIEWAAAMLREVDNFRAVLDWAVETPSPGYALRLVAPFTVTGVAIGDAARDWAGTACAIPGGRDHPLFPTVAGFAALAAAFAREFERAEALVAMADEAEALLGTSSSSLLRGRAVTAYFQGDFENAQRFGEEWVTLARASGDAFELAHALLMLAGPKLASDYDNGAATFDEALRVARAAGNTSALSIALTVVAGFRRLEDSNRAFALLDEAAELGNRVGDNLAVAEVVIMRAAIAWGRGDWSSALRAAVDGAERHFQLGHLANLSRTFFLGGTSLYQLGFPEPAVVLVAWADMMGEPVGDAEGLEQLATMRVELRASLAEERFAMLSAEGAAMSPAEAFAYLRAHAELALATPT
jgi:predicted ATPase/class 3 adenylate cyclase